MEQKPIGTFLGSFRRRMTAPAIVKPGDVLLCTMRVVGRMFLLRPDPELVQAVEYVVMHYAEKYGLRIHSLIVMSSHIHVSYSDLLGNGPEFRRDVHALIGRYVSRMRNWRGTVLCAPNKVRSKTTFSMVDEMAYVVKNAETAGLVEQATDWSGLISTPERIGAPARTVARPEAFFDEDGDMPDDVESSFHFPYAALDERGVEGTKRLFGECLARYGREAKGRRKKSGWKVVGAAAALVRSPYDRATSYEDYGSISPRFATRGGGPAAFFAAVEELHTFLAAYAFALAEWRGGNREVKFPFGTYKMRVLHGAHCYSGP